MFPSRAIDKETFPLHFHSKWKTILLLHSSELQLCLQIEQDELNLNLVQTEKHEKKHSSSNVSRKQGPTLLSLHPNSAKDNTDVVQWQRRLKELDHLVDNPLWKKQTHSISQEKNKNLSWQKKERKGVESNLFEWLEQSSGRNFLFQVEIFLRLSLRKDWLSSLNYPPSKYNKIEWDLRLFFFSVSPLFFFFSVSPLFFLLSDQTKNIGPSNRVLFSVLFCFWISQVCFFKQWKGKRFGFWMEEESGICVCGGFLKPHFLANPIASKKCQRKTVIFISLFWQVSKIETCSWNVLDLFSSTVNQRLSNNTSHYSRQVSKCVRLESHFFLQKKLGKNHF